MSLYSSLTQVLAPFAAKINGLLTGWDGTKYSTPGEAVRRQIFDLHVLIGDEPGTAISASAISYENSNVSEALDTVTEEITSVTSRIQACENELGTHPEIEYVLPEGYESIDKENSAHTQHFKYIDGEISLYIQNPDTGECGAKEVTSSGYDLSTLGYAVDASKNQKLAIRIKTCTYPSEANPTLTFRFYNSDYSSSKSAYVYFTEAGDIDIDLKELAEQYNVNLSTYPNFIIRAFGHVAYTSAAGGNTMEVTIPGFFEPVVSTALSDRVSTNETNIAKNSEDIDTLSGNVDSLSESVSGYDGRIASNTQSIEGVKSELGLDYTYTLPEGYKSADYESSNGLRKAKYENGKFVFYNKNTNVGSVSGTEITTSAFGQAVSQDLVLDVRTVDHPVLSFDYANTYSAEITPTLNLRMYNAELSSSKPIYVYIPIGSGHIDVDILKEIEDNNINTETHPMLLIRSIGMGEHTATGEEVLSTAIEGFYDDGDSILNTVASLANNIESVKEYGTNKTSCTFQNPFRFNKPYWAHFFLNTVNDADIYVPSQSLYDIQISKRMGFDVIEANVHTLSDGTAICLHGDNFKFGVEFESADGVTDVQNTVIASVDYEWVKTYVRYKAKFPKLRVCPPTLEEFLLECKKYRMIPYMNFRDPSHIELADKIMGLENYVLYGDGGAARRYSNAMVASWGNFTTKQQIVDWVKKVGNPCMVGCMHPENFTAEEWVDIIETVHQMGAVIAWSEYNSPSDWLKLIDYGMDMTGATYGLNPTEHGNLQNFSSALGFSDYTVVNGTESPGQLTMQNGGTVTLANTIGSAKFLTGMWLDVTFIGSISVSMGRFITHANCQSTSTKSKTIRLSTYFMNAIPNFEVKALSAGTIIENIDCKVSEF